MSIISLIPLIALAFTPVLANVISQSPMLAAVTDNNQTLVPVLLGVMSRCPDAFLCESLFDDILKQIGDIIDIDLTFIGKLNESDSEYGVTCKHGVEECRGNVHELCAIDRSESQQDWWHFLQCLNYGGISNVGDTALAERCAGVASIPWDDEISDGTTIRRGVKGCVESQEGTDLLKASVRRTQRNGIEKSCTVMISGKTRCIHDTTWKSCETGHTVDEFISYIEEEYQRLNNQTSSKDL